METLEGLRRKLNTAEALHSVVRTMKTLAAVSIRQYERAAEALDGYGRTVELGLQVVLRAGREVPRGGRRDLATGLGAIVFGSDQGLCGQLNDRITGVVLETLTPAATSTAGSRLTPAAASAPRPLLLAAAGTRVASRLEDIGLPPEHVLTMPDSVDGISARVEDLLLLIEQWQAGHGLEEVVLIHSRHLGGASYRPEVVTLLPIDQRWTGGLAVRDWPATSLPTFTMDSAALLAALIREHLFVNLFRAFAESLASENAARLASMQGAERSIEERLAELVRRYHLQRQAAITEELLDIISGFEAL